MHMFVKVSVPVVTGNKAIQDGSLPRIIGTFLETAKPAAAFFGTDETGQRTGYFVVEVKDAAQIPPIFEPLFLGLDAQIAMTPVMTAAELQAGLAALAR